MEKSANQNNQDDIGYTALHYAIQKRNYEGALLLLNSNDINVNVRNLKIYNKASIINKFFN